MADCLIGLGSNLGDRATLLDHAVEQVCGHPQVIFRAVSSYHETDPIGGPDGQGRFLNAALRVATQLSPLQLLALTKQVERQLGRERAERWGPRLIDIDLLLYNRTVLETAELTLPHPRMAVRRCMLAPAHEIAAGMIHSGTGWSVATLLNRLNEPPTYVALAGAHNSGKTDLALEFAERADVQLILDPGMPTSQKAAPGDSDQIGRQELEAVARRMEQLSALGEFAKRAPQRVILSDFWLNQTLVVSRAWFDDSMRKQLEKACRAAIEAVPLPTFVLFLDTPVDTLVARGRESADTSPLERTRSSLAHFCRELQWQAALPGQGPVLRVAGGELKLAMIELTAAMDAIR